MLNNKNKKIKKTKKKKVKFFSQYKIQPGLASD